MINGLDLFSGIGGISIALAPWVRPIAYCENDRYAQSVLLSQMQVGTLPCAAIWDDITKLHSSNLGLPVDIIYGGFPCQDISVAGNGKGLEGKRSGLFKEIARLTEECNPKFIFLENVPAIRTRGLGKVVRAFTDLRYDCRWTCVSAAEVGAPHLRKRWFLLAHNTNERCNWQAAISQKITRESQSEIAIERNGQAQSLANALGSIWDDEPKKETRSFRRQEESRFTRIGSKIMANTECERLEGFKFKTRQSQKPKSRGENWWATEPNVGRVVNGLPNRVDRIKCLGNSVVPMQAREAFKKLMNFE